MEGGGGYGATSTSLPRPPPTSRHGRLSSRTARTSIDSRRAPSPKRYLLDAGPDGASCSRTDRDANLRLPIDALASVWLGGLRATQLVAARRIVEVSPGAAARLDRLVATDRAPWTPYEF